MQSNRMPLVPSEILIAHNVHEPADTRFQAAARLLQALWREDQGLPIGTHCSKDREPRKLGSRIEIEIAKKGGNFMSQAIAKLAYQESVYREIGAVIDQERLWANMLSSQPLCFNLFGTLKLDLNKGNRFFQYLFPDYVASVEGIYFEHSPGRGKSAFTEDGTAFDVFVICTTPDGQRGFIAIEVKYSESMSEPLAALRPRYDELSQLSGVYSDPDSLSLRKRPLQQLWREHILSCAMIKSGLYSSGRFVFIYPAKNHHCEEATKLYQTHLVSSVPKISGYQAMTLEDFVDTFRAIGEHETADAFYGRYLNFQRVEEAIFEGRFS